MNKHVEPPVRLGASAAEPAARRAPASARVETDRSKTVARFKAAARHSRRVRFFRWALPVGVTTALGLTLAVNYLDPFSIAVDLPFELGRISLSGSKVKMEFPKLHGFTSDNRGYSVTAEAAYQDLTKPDAIDLETIAAKLELADHGWVNLVAATGHYDTKTEKLMLDGGIRFDTSSGYGGHLQNASVDIKGGKLVSKKPVEFTYLDGKLTADSIEVTQKDSRALLVGNVQLDFKMPPADGAKPSDGARPSNTANASGAANASATSTAAATPPASRTAAAAQPTDIFHGAPSPVPVVVNGATPANVPLPPRRPPQLRGATTVGATP
ncbi:conserved hypothetical protein [Ancylobacter novellus DSM 506]|uniref:LPS export ABC transporter periplasmic protein LptC n=1 Tax=Ancylobacter novellus (strain ATCC 8093 / DSM 506 / JCM 20403 / CCM 1077 / IAM 12100 / NBRC 12443 / NCIMB 10456) TaxID=639283 RepID=D7A266_ANCN5|nr:hypothetical protein [Ancylobacter novellus]ADH87682.1 conserved hypothetical protein [Ancylobacter novellus DSM 506]